MKQHVCTKSSRVAGLWLFLNKSQFPLFPAFHIFLKLITHYTVSSFSIRNCRQQKARGQNSYIRGIQVCDEDEHTLLSFPLLCEHFHQDLWATQRDITSQTLTFSLQAAHQKEVSRVQNKIFYQSEEVTGGNTRHIDWRPQLTCQNQLP